MTDAGIRRSLEERVHEEHGLMLYNLHNHVHGMEKSGIEVLCFFSKA